MSVLNGPSPSTQIINLERMVEERDQKIAELLEEIERLKVSHVWTCSVGKEVFVTSDPEIAEYWKKDGFVVTLKTV